MEFVDFDECRRVTGHGYRGNAGRKLSYLYKGNLWMVKFPGSTKDMQGKHLPSYTTGPLSEYIGSQIYAALGVPVHDTLLGVCQGKLVVGCRDFTDRGELLEYSQIKNTVDDVLISGSYGSSAAGERLSDVLRVIDSSEEFEGRREEVRRHFWDMFVIDAFIHNNDRNNGNWGLLVGRYETSVAPVYDNGNAFFNKRNPSLTGRRLADEKLIAEDALSGRSFFLDDNDRRIDPFSYMGSKANDDCTAAALRFEGHVDFPLIESIIDAIPNSFEGIDVITREQQEFYKALLRETYAKGFVPVLKNLP